MSDALQAVLLVILLMILVLETKVVITVDGVVHTIGVTLK